MTDDTLHCMLGWSVEFALLARVKHTTYFLPTGIFLSSDMNTDAMYGCRIPMQEYNSMGVARQMGGQARCDEAIPSTPANAHICVFNRQGAADDSMQHRAV